MEVVVFKPCLKANNRQVYRINVRVHKESEEGEDAGHGQDSTVDVGKAAFKILVEI